MAVIEVSNTKRIAALLGYCKNPEKVGATNCWNLINLENAKRDMAATRKLWGKNGGIQGFHIIQSFAPGEITPQKANRLGLELIKKIAPNFEAVIYTHQNTSHIHNHIVINSVSFLTGKKYHQTNFKGSGKFQSGSVNLSQIKKESDIICMEHGLSVINEKSARTRKSMAERKMEARGERPWKTDLRAAITEASLSCKNLSEMKQKLSKENIEMYIRGQNLSFRFPGQNRNIRGKSLGEDFTKNNIEKSLNLTKQKPTFSGKAWENLKAIRQQMKAENDPTKKAELQKHFQAAKMQVENNRKTFFDNKERKRIYSKEIDRDR